MVEISETQRAEYKDTFKLFDTTASGMVPAADLGLLLRSVGEAPTNALVTELAASFNNNNNTMNFEQFLQAIAAVREKCPKPAMKELETAFLTLDKSGTGEIDVDELKNLLTSMGEPLEANELDDVLKHVKVGKNNKVACAALAKLLSS